ncbi:MAG: PIG-L family deacetylase, partial [Candidatus Obscuribacter sp.]|nr:PIG-L family deacetylase [Candidatus Obscuribacter sp.]
KYYSIAKVWTEVQITNVKVKKNNATKWCRAALCALSLICTPTNLLALSMALSSATPLFCEAAQGTEMKTQSPQVILQELKSLKQMGSVLYVAAHPDDENTELLAYLARGRNYRTAYLSLTRGDGGQNVLGSDLGAKLGIARTEELMAARDIDGARQYFSRAVDFGFSKNYVETLKVWDKQEILSDVVRVIRLFKPDVIVTRFSPSPGGTHGHHTASTVLAMEAFKLAGDASAFPEQIAEGLLPWQPKRIMWNVSIWQKDKVAQGDILKIDAGGKDAISGQLFTEIAAKSRAMHKTQGFDQFTFPGASGGERLESFQLLDGEPAKKDIMDGIDTSWQRVEGGLGIEQLIDKTIAQFNQDDATASVPQLLELRSKLATLPPSKDMAAVVSEKRSALDNILAQCLGLTTTTHIDQSEVVPGETVTLKGSASLKTQLPDGIQVKLLSTRYPIIDKEIKRNLPLLTGEQVSWTDTAQVPASAHVEHPWWLRQPGSAGLFTTSDNRLIGSALNTPAFPVQNIFAIGDQIVALDCQPVELTSATSNHQINPMAKAATVPVNISSSSKPLKIIAPVSLHFDLDTVVLAPGKTKTVTVEVTSARTDATGTLQLDAPAGWHISPASKQFRIDKIGQSSKIQFKITAPDKPGTVDIRAKATVGGITFDSKREVISYAHIPPQMMHAPAVVRAVALDLAVSGHRVGFIPGAGEALPSNLSQMGYEVTTLDDNLTANQLKGLDAVILGVRAFNVRKEIDRAMPLLFDYVKDGGTVIVQYVRPDKLHTTKIAPYPLTIYNGRVTDENATVTFLDPQNALLNIPNKITSADFDHWVQERGLYFGEKWDDNFKPLLSCADPGEEQLKGGLLVAKYGKGHYIYTGLSFFRELPAGVPGAYRLLANLIAAGK